MSGVVSYELLKSKFGGGNSGFTSDGGYYETFVNNTGTSVKGTIVCASASVYNAVDIAPADAAYAIGVIYESGITNGNQVKVVVSGKAQVLLKNTLASTFGYWCGVSDTGGRMYQSPTVPSTTEYYREIGHSLESKTAGDDVLSLVQIHFN
jgi:hypothetical protein